jgi:hypothetical protein
MVITSEKVKKFNDEKTDGAHFFCKVTCFLWQKEWKLAELK